MFEFRSVRSPHRRSAKAVQRDELRSKSHCLSPMQKRIARWTGGGILILIWAIAAALIHHDVLLPGPLRVLKEVWHLLASGQALQVILGSFLRWFCAFLGAFLLGIISGSIAYRFRLLREAIRPLITAIRSIPVIAAILIALVWLPLDGVGILIGILVAFPLIHQGCLDGLRTVDYGLIEMGKAFQLSPLKTISHIFLPGSLPVLLSALFGAVGMSWKAVIAAEVLSQPPLAIGTRLFTAKQYIDTPQVFAWTLIAIAVAGLADSVLFAMQRFAQRPYRRHTRLKNLPLHTKQLQGSLKSPLLDLAKQAKPTSIHCRKVQFSFPGTCIFSGLNIEISPGSINVIVGPSGCGKTTLLRLAAGLIEPDSGTINHSPQQTKTAFVFQDSRLLPWANLEQNLSLSLHGISRKLKQELCQSVLNHINIPDAHAYPHQLSGGMQQRINLARGFLQHSGLLCLDEPFANQDHATRTELAELTRSLHSAYRPTILWVTHDPGEAIQLADRIIKLERTDRCTRISHDVELNTLSPGERSSLLDEIIR